MRGPVQRAGSVLVLVLALLVLFGLLLARMQNAGTREAVLTRAHGVGTEHAYLAESIAVRIMDRLQRRSWDVRYYAGGGAGTGPWALSETGTYQGGDYLAWVQDVSEGGGPALPGLVDIFLRLTLRSRARNYLYRVSLLGPSKRRPYRAQIEYFDRVPEDIEGPEARREVAARASAHMRAAAKRRASTQVMHRLVRDVSVLGDADLGTALEVLHEELPPGVLESRESTLKQIGLGVHLLGEAGRPYQGLLPPLERHRFTNMVPAFGPARNHLQEAIEQAGENLDLLLISRNLLGISFFAEAWQIGPASARGQELLTRGLTALEGGLTALDAAGEAERRTLDPTLPASLLLDVARVAIVAGRPETAEEAQRRLATSLPDRAVLFGARVELDRVQTNVFGALDTAAARARRESDRPLLPSGFLPVTEEAVGSFLGTPETGWTAWPVDSGRPAAWWDEEYLEQEARAGEGGTGAPSGNYDRDGDGYPDLDTTLGLPPPGGAGGPGALGGGFADCDGDGESDDDDEGCGDDGSEEDD